MRDVRLRTTKKALADMLTADDVEAQFATLCARLGDAAECVTPEELQHLFREIRLSSPGVSDQRIEDAIAQMAGVREVDFD